MRTYKVLFIFFVIALLAGGALPMQAQGKGPEQVGLRPDAPEYAKHGPFWVGARDFTIKDDKPPLTVTVWYPASNPQGVKEAITYKIAEDSAAVALAGPNLTVQGHAIQDAAPDAAKAPYSLVVFSPGLAMWRQSEVYYLEHLASYGFVVIAADPRGETWEDFWAGAATRPIDTGRLIAYAETLTAAGGSLAKLIDTDHISVIGHSSGGWTALVGGGAQMSLGWCAANPDKVAENSLSNCGQFVPHQEEIAKMLGLATVPTGLWPHTNDPRVQAVVSMAPDGDIWGANYEGVAALTLPVLLMGGSGDTLNIPELCSRPIYEHLGSANKTFVLLSNADHFVFGNSCFAESWTIDGGFFGSCSDSVWDMDRAHDLINHFITAFLLDILKSDKEAHKALLPDVVKFVGIEYRTTMK